MDFIYLFTSLQGHVNRAKWRAGEAVLFLVFSATAFIGNQTTIGPAISALIWIVLYLPAYPSPRSGSKIAISQERRLSMATFRQLSRLGC